MKIEWHFYSWNCLLDMAVCGSILLALGLLVEWLCRTRPWRLLRPRYSLGTAVLLMLVAGVLLGANLQPSAEGDGYSWRAQAWGWPFCVYTAGKSYGSEGCYARDDGDPTESEFDLTRAGLNLAVGLAMLIGIGIALEKWLLDRWCRLRGSTRAVLVLTFAALLWANLSPAHKDWEEGGDINYGWPLRAYCETHVGGIPSQSRWDYEHFTLDRLAADIAVALAILTALGAVLQRRRGTGSRGRVEDRWVSAVRQPFADFP